MPASTRTHIDVAAWCLLPHRALPLRTHLQRLAARKKLAITITALVARTGNAPDRRAAWRQARRTRVPRRRTRGSSTSLHGTASPPRDRGRRVGDAELAREAGRQPRSRSRPESTSSHPRDLLRIHRSSVNDGHATVRDPPCSILLHTQFRDHPLEIFDCAAFCGILQHFAALMPDGSSDSRHRADTIDHLARVGNRVVLPSEVSHGRFAGLVRACTHLADPGDATSRVGFNISSP